MYHSISKIGNSYHMDRINNAYFSRFRKPVVQRVVCSESMQLHSLGYKYRWVVCNRQKSTGTRLMSRQFCEILGPDLCSDCIKSRDRVLSAHSQRCYFPNACAYPRSISAPAKVGRLRDSEHMENTNQASCSPTSLKSEEEHDLYSICSVDELLRRLRRQHTMYTTTTPSKVQEKKPTVRFDDKKKLNQYSELLDISPPMI